VSAIEILGVHKAFDSQQVLRGVDLCVPAGHSLALLGESGSGKTVLLRHLLGLLQPDRGEVRIDGEDVGRADAEALERIRLKLGVLFQSGGLFDSLTALENVMFPLREHLRLSAPAAARRAAEALELVQLQDAKQLFPAQLSGGMQKRLALARALVAAPQILLLDDPTAGLDPLTTDAVTAVIRRAQRAVSATSLVITHDLPLAFSVADRVALLSEGRIALEASAEEFQRSRHPAVRAYLKQWLARRDVRSAAPGAATPPSP